MRIRTVYFNRFRNEMHYQFFVRLIALWTECKLSTTFLNQAIDPLKKSFEKLDAIIRLLQASLSTPDIVKADKKRDGVYRGLVKVVKAVASGRSTELQESADKVLTIIKNYGKIDTLPYEEETGSITNMLQELDKYSAKYPGLFQNMGIESWVKDLRELNEQFDKYWIERNQAWAEQPNYKVGEARQEIEEEYRKLVAIVQGHGYFAPPTSPSYGYSSCGRKEDPASFVDYCNDFLNSLNDLIAEYNQAILIREGRAQAKKEEQEGGELLSN